MKRTPWLKGLWQSMNHSARRRPGSMAVANSESLEARELMSATALFIPDTGELNIEMDSSDNVVVSSQNGIVQVEEEAANGTFTPISSLGTLSAALVQSITIVGGDDGNTIDLNGVTAAEFTALTAIAVDAGNGHDMIIGSPDFGDSLNGGHGNDTILGQGGNDTLVGSDGNDSIVAADGDDSVRGGDGQDSITGGAGNDSIEGGDGSDTVAGGDGNDFVFAGNGQDSVTGDAGNDTLNGDGGIDTLRGGDGNDSMLGGEFNDLIVGDAGDDTLLGQGGNDTLIGVTGFDHADGGAGNDVIQSALGTPVDAPVPAPAQPAQTTSTPAPLPDAIDSTLGVNTGLLNHAIGTGRGDGSLNVEVTSTGAFGTSTALTSASAGAPFDPIGAIGVNDTTFDSELYFRANTMSGARATLESLATNRSNIRGTAEEANSTFDVGTLHFVLTQLVEPVFDTVTGAQVGSLLTQTYRVTNTGVATSDFELARYFDGDLRFDGSINDGGGRLVSAAGDEFLFETDAGGTAASSTFVGITAKGGTIPTTNRFEIDQFPTLQNNIQGGAALDGQILNDTNGDQSIDVPYDVTLGLRNTFNLAANASATYTTHTLFGTGTPSQLQLNQRPVAVADTAVAVQGQPIAIDVVSNDFDVDGTLDYTSIQIVQAPLFGTVLPLQDGRVIYTPNPGFNGTDSFAYTIADNLGARSAPAVVTLTVNAADTIGDALNGGLGNDTINGSDGNDTILGGGGNDSLFGGLGNDRIQGQGGNDTVIGGGGADILDGGDGNDLIQSTPNSVAINAVSVTEGDTGTVTAVFTVGLATASDVPVTVNFFTTGITATSGVDFLPVSGTLTFAPGVTSQTIVVPIIGDTVQESTETFLVTLISPSNATVFNGGGVGTIIDNDTPIGVALTRGPVVNASRLPGSQAEVTIAVNPTNTQNVVAVANGATAAGEAQFIANSFDGGLTWAIRVLTFTQDTIGTAANSDRFDAAVAFDKFGNLHVVYMARVTTATTADSAIIYATSADGGITFATQILNPLSPAVDKPWLATGPDAANPANEVVYVTYQAAAGLVARGATVTGIAAVGAFSAATPFTTAGNYAVPSVGPNGEFTVTWMNPAGGQGPADVLFDRDLDGLVGGLTFGTDTIITSSEAGGFDFIPATPDRSTFASPYLAYDRSTSPHSGRLYCAYADEAPAESNDLNIFVRFSDDNGTTWSTPTRVNDDTGTNSQFFQSISVDQTNGNVYLSWYDARNDVGAGGTNSDGVPNTDVETFMAVSVDGAASFGPNFLVSTAASNQARDVNDPGNDFGDYAGITVHNNVAYVIWADNSNSTGDNPDGRTTFDVYTARVDATLLTAPSSGNSVGTAVPIFIDLGDTMTGGAGNDTVIGSNGDDVINGNAGDDLLSGGDGNDSILGGAGSDTLLGGNGDDTLDGQAGNDSIDGGAGSDTIVLNLAGGNDVGSNTGGLDVVQVNGDNTANVITIGQVNRRMIISLGTSSITVDSSVQYVVVNALGGNDTVTITDLDTVAGSVLTVNGGNGNDLLDATGANIGNVRLRLAGQDGNDTINGSLGNDTLDGGAGDDSICGWAGNDTIIGGLGDDLLGGSLGNDSINGSDGNDSINGQQGDDSVQGGAGNDTLKGDDGNDTMLGGAGDDNMNGMAGDDSLLGGVGKDGLIGGNGNDTLDGGRNDDTIGGNAGDDLIRGDHGNDVINAGDGNNTVFGGDGNDTINSGSGNDIIRGGDGNDRINSDAGDDIITGGDGADVLLGGGGQDIILGGDGNDTIDGQGGTDTIAGNQGADVISDPVAEIDEMFQLGVNVLAILQAG